MKWGRYHGKFTRFNPKKPQGWGACDNTGVWTMRKDLVRQYEFNGDGLYDTGFLVNKHYKFKPQIQLLKPIILADPYSFTNPPPRPDPNLGGNQQ